MPDFARIKSNISTMISKGAPEKDIDAYVASEGTTAEELQNEGKAPDGTSAPSGVPFQGTELTAPQMAANKQAADSINPFQAAVNHQGGWGLSQETRNALGADDSSGGDVPVQLLKAGRNIIPNAADAAYRAYQGLGVGIEGAAKTVDNVLDKTGIADALSLGGNKFHLGDAAMALMEAFPAGGLESGITPHGSFTGPAVDNITPELRAQLNNEASALFQKGASFEEMNAWAKDRGLNPYGDDFKEAIQARDAAQKTNPGAALPVEDVKKAVTDLHPLAEEAKNFKPSPEPVATDVFPTEASEAAKNADIETRLRQEASAYNSDPLPVEPTPEADPMPGEDPATISKKEANALFKEQTEAPKAQTSSEWAQALQASADDFNARTKPAEPVEANAPEPVPDVAPTPESAPDEAPTPSSEPVPPAADVVTRLTDALNNAQSFSKAQQISNGLERSARLKAVVAARKAGPGGQEGFYNELAALKGPLKKVSTGEVGSQFTQEDLDSLFSAIQDNPKLSVYDQISARTGLGKLLDGQVPAPAELNHLSRVFPPDFVKAAMSHRATGAKLLDHFAEAVSLPRSLMSTLDLSAPGRQGMFLIGTKEYWKSIGPMFHYFASKSGYEALGENIMNRQTFPLMEEAGLSLTDIGTDLTKREEAFIARLPGKIPVFGTLHQASERAYTGFLNKLRADTFDRLVNESRKAGVSFDKDPKALKDIGRFVNAATGRGDLGQFTQAGPALSGVFYSPRLIASRANLLNPAFYANLSPVVRREAIKSAMAFGGIALTIASLMKMYGPKVSVETDARSSDFLKIKIGNTRFDYLGGFGQFITLGARLATNQTKTLKGEVKDMGKTYGSPNRFDALIQFGTNKEAPVLSFLTDYLKGKNATGQPFDLKSEAAQRMIPLFLQDVYDINTDPNSAGPLAAVPGVFGVGTQNFDENANGSMSKRVQNNLATMKSKGASPGEIKAYIQSEVKAKTKGV